MSRGGCGIGAPRWVGEVPVPPRLDAHAREGRRRGHRAERVWMWRAASAGVRRAAFGVRSAGCGGRRERVGSAGRPVEVAALPRPTSRRARRRQRRQPSVLSRPVIDDRAEPAHPRVERPRLAPRPASVSSSAMRRASPPVAVRRTRSARRRDPPVDWRWTAPLRELRHISDSDRLAVLRAAGAGLHDEHAGHLDVPAVPVGDHLAWAGPQPPEPHERIIQARQDRGLRRLRHHTSLSRGRLRRRLG